MRVAAVQLTSTQDVEANLARIAHWVRIATTERATLVALPENALFLRTEPGTKAPVEPLDGPLASRLRAIAAEHGVWLLVGSFPERGPDPNHAYNTSLLIDGTASDAPITAVYRKIHLFDVDLGREVHRESDTIAAGREVVCAKLAGVTVGLSICYDLRFPWLYQRLVDQGAQLITIPAAFTEYTGKDHWLVLCRARAIETQCYVIAPGQYGHHGGVRRSFGKSSIIDPWGIPVGICSDGEGLVTATLDLELVARVRRSLPCLAHRRDDL
jgi:predicted amidohydrolase